MATCRFCGRSFGSSQSVRAHLKSCASYVRSKGAVPRVPRLPRERDEDLGDPGEREMDLVENPVTRELDRMNRLIGAELERDLRESLERARGAGRRQIIQRVKDEVLGWRAWGDAEIPAEVKARALQEIERELSALPVEELPRHELVQIAEGARDRVYRPAVQEREAARKREERAEEEARNRTERKRALIQRGVTYARRELAGAEGLHYADRLRIRSAVERRLQQEISGQESETQVRELVDLVLDEELGE